MSPDLDTYERLGNLDAPFADTVKDERRQRHRQRLGDAMDCEVAPLTYEQYCTGQPCPGCGRPYVDAEPFEPIGTMFSSDSERARYIADEARFKEAGQCMSLAIRSSVESASAFFASPIIATYVRRCEPTDGSPRTRSSSSCRSCRS